MKKEENKQIAVIPTAELLSEIENLIVFAGKGDEKAEPLGDTSCTKYLCDLKFLLCFGSGPESKDNCK